jgi:D-sedoheptulose 7-phosphate isomerase
MEPLDTYFHEVAASLVSLSRTDLDAIARAIMDTYQRDGTIIVCGNGGSAATASHFACDLAKWTHARGRRRVRAMALTDNVPVMTAWANDVSYNDVFVEQLMSHYRPGDLLVAISGSGNSENVLRAVAWANSQGAPTVGLTGFDGGTLARIVTHSLHTQNYSMPQVEDVHMAVCHGLAVNLGVKLDESLLLNTHRLQEVAA